MYIGTIYDSCTGFYYFGARYYEPNVGRFITEDNFNGTKRDPLSQNRYVYAEDNPIKFIDPNGHSSQRPMDEASWFLNVYVPSHFAELASVISTALIMVISPALEHFAGKLQAVVFSVLTSGVGAVSDSMSFIQDALHGNVLGVTKDIINLSGSVLGTFSNSLPLLEKIEAVGAIAGWQLASAATGETLSEVSDVLGIAGLTISVTRFATDAQSAYLEYQSSYQDSSSSSSTSGLTVGNGGGGGGRGHAYSF